MMVGALHRVVRWPLSLIPPRAVMPVLSGPLRGTRWVVGAGTHGAWLGWYERENQRLFEQVLGPGDFVVDVGANVGFFSLLAARLVGGGGKVLAVEPYPPNLETLRRHLTLNKSVAIDVVPLALSHRSGVASFAASSCGAFAKLDDSGELSVAIDTLDAVVRSLAWPRPPRLIKIDVEGAEVDVLRGGVNTITASPRPALLIATHGSNRYRECLQLLESSGVAAAEAQVDETTGNGRIVVAGGERNLVRR